MQRTATHAAIRTTPPTGAGGRRQCVGHRWQATNGGTGALAFTASRERIDERDEVTPVNRAITDWVSRARLYIAGHIRQRINRGIADRKGVDEGNEVGSINDTVRTRRISTGNISRVWLTARHAEKTEEVEWHRTVGKQQRCKEGVVARGIISKPNPVSPELR